jgi:hypothetical protein
MASQVLRRCLAATSPSTPPLATTTFDHYHPLSPTSMGWHVSFSFISLLLTIALHRYINALPPPRPPGSRLRAGLVLQPYDSVLPPHQRHHPDPSARDTPPHRHRRACVHSIHAAHHQSRRAATVTTAAAAVGPLPWSSPHEDR